MFKKLIVVDAKGHLLGRLASYIAKALLSGTNPKMQDKELQSSDAKESISPALSSEIKSNFQSFSGKDFSLTPAELSFIIVLPPESSGELLEGCSLTKPLEEQLLLAD